MVLLVDGVVGRCGVVLLFDPKLHVVVGGVLWCLGGRLGNSATQAASLELESEGGGLGQE